MSKNSHKSQIKDVLLKNNLKIAQSETWASFYIGIDEIQKKLIFLNFKGKEVEEQIIDIKNVKECQIVEKRKFFKIKDKQDSVLEHLNLHLNLNNGEVLDLVFFDTNLNYKEDFELKRIEKWKFIITSLITQERNAKKAA
tara:strand:+ start:40 stop:459 length:420 start_codon:yes stop_codon:yes gene_type:complete